MSEQQEQPRAYKCIGTKWAFNYRAGSESERPQLMFTPDPFQAKGWVCPTFDYDLASDAADLLRHGMTAARLNAPLATPGEPRCPVPGCGGPIELWDKERGIGPLLLQAERICHCHHCDWVGCISLTLDDGARFAELRAEIAATLPGASASPNGDPSRVPVGDWPQPMRFCIWRIYKPTKHGGETWMVNDDPLNCVDPTVREDGRRQLSGDDGRYWSKASGHFPTREIAQQVCDLLNANAPAPDPTREALWEEAVDLTTTLAEVLFSCLSEWHFKYNAAHPDETEAVALIDRARAFLTRLAPPAGERQGGEGV